MIPCLIQLKLPAIGAFFLSLIIITNSLSSFVKCVGLIFPLRRKSLVKINIPSNSVQIVKGKRVSYYLVLSWEGMKEEEMIILFHEPGYIDYL